MQTMSENRTTNPREHDTRKSHLAVNSPSHVKQFSKTVQTGTTVRCMLQLLLNTMVRLHLALQLRIRSKSHHLSNSNHCTLLKSTYLPRNFCNLCDQSINLNCTKSNRNKRALIPKLFTKVLCASQNGALLNFWIRIGH